MQVANPDAASSAATAKANEPEAQKPEAPVSSQRPQTGTAPSGTKRARPPYLRLVD